MQGGGNRIYGRHIKDSLQNAKSLTIFEDFVVQGQGQGQIGPWGSSRTRTFLEDYNTGLYDSTYLINKQQT